MFSIEQPIQQRSYFLIIGLKRSSIYSITISILVIRLALSSQIIRLTSFKIVDYLLSMSIVMPWLVNIIILFANPCLFHNFVHNFNFKSKWFNITFNKNEPSKISYFIFKSLACKNKDLSRDSI